MKNRMTGPGLILMLLLFLVHVSCHRKVAVPLETVERTDIRSFLEQGPYQWDWYSCTGTANMQSSLFSGSGQYTLRMKRDSLLWVAVRFVGIEVARIQADRDSMVILNRFERNVEAYSWEEVTRRTGFPASLDAVQRTVLGWLPIIPSALQTMDSNDRSVNVMGKEGAIQMMASLIEPDLIPRSCQFRDTGSGAVAEGSQVIAGDNLPGVVPAERTWDMRQDDQSRLFLQIHVQDPSFTGPLSFPFDIPERYARHR